MELILSGFGSGYTQFAFDKDGQAVLMRRHDMTNEKKTNVILTTKLAKQKTNGLARIGWRPAPQSVWSSSVPKFYSKLLGALNNA